MTRVETVSFVHQSPKILLAVKKERFGKGNLNGFGGKIENWETPKEGVKREAGEEGKIKLINPRQVGKITFKFQTEEENHIVYCFRATRYEGTPDETKEMKPEWFEDKKIPYDRMWDADKYWLPLLLENKRFEGNFLYDHNHEIIKHELKIQNK